jgi:hypothetical protein
MGSTNPVRLRTHTKPGAALLGKFTDIKRVAGVEVVAATKPEGLGMPESVSQKLYARMLRDCYMPTEAPRRSSSQMPKRGDYSKARSEIRIPVRKVAESK